MDLVVSPAILALNTQSGSQKNAMTLGQLIDALVLELIDATTVRVAVADNVLELKTDIPLVPGAHVRLAARGHGDNIHWVITGLNNLPAGSRGAESAQTNGRTASSPTSASTGAPATTAKGGASVATDGEVRTAQPRPEVQQPVRPAQVASTAAAEFATATRAAAVRQTGLAPLFADLKPVIMAMPGVPVAVKQAAAQVLAAPVALDTPSSDVLKRAVSQSGLFLEARLAGEDGMPPSVSPGDLKAALLTLRSALKGWLDTLPASLPTSLAKAEAPVHAPPLVPQQASPTDLKPPPPYRGAPTAGQHPAAATISPDALPRDVVQTLLGQTEGAIARQVLMQVASLPDATGVGSVHSDGADKHWNLEIPFVTPQGTAIAHFEIQRDGNRTASREMPVVAWRVNFSLDFEPVGPIHAQVALTGKRAAVNIWAERSDTATALRSSISELSTALHAVSLDTGDVIVRDGAPPRPLKASPGRFLDRAS